MGAEHVVVELGDEVVHRRPRQRGDRGGGAHPRVGIGRVAAQQAVEAGEEVVVAGVVGHEPDHDRIEPELAEHAARLDGEGDDARDEALQRACA